MDSHKCMIVDLEKPDGKRMFVTEQVSSISKNNSLMLYHIRYFRNLEVSLIVL